MNKEKLMINYCINTAIDGFEADSREIEGEKWLANICVDILNSNMSIYKIKDILKTIIEKSKTVFDEDFFNGALSMYLDIIEQIEIINSDKFEIDYEYEIKYGVFCDGQQDI